MRENSCRDGGIEEPYRGPSAKRRQGVGWGKDAACLRVRRPTSLRGEPPRRDAGETSKEEAVRGED